MAKKIVLLGSTGSIGTQSLDVARAQGYKVLALAAGKNVDRMLQQIAEFAPKAVAMADEGAADTLRARLAGMAGAPRVYSGRDGLVALSRMEEADVVLNAVVGIAGLPATLAALQAGHDVALANKESLVTGGYLVTNAAKENSVKLLPVDSEHSAIFQCLQDEYSARTLQKILLTASGGPFFGRNRQQLAHVTKEDALRHPNWAMGAKITIDSASMMNKGLELIEAVWLFGLRPEQVQIVVQRQSIIHSMVQFSVIIPFWHSLACRICAFPSNTRLPGRSAASAIAPELDFTQLRELTFDTADEETFRCLAACKKAIAKGGLAPCAANGANEEAVRLVSGG